MTQAELIKSWLEGANEGKVGSVGVAGDRLIHYSTVIAERYGDKVILNYTRYSLASGKVQKMVAGLMPRESIVLVSGVEAGYKSSLTALLPKRDYASPEEWLMEVRHDKFDTGYVIAASDNLITCDFSGQVRTLMWPNVVDMGIVEVVKDLRNG